MIKTTLPNEELGESEKQEINFLEVTQPFREGFSHNTVAAEIMKSLEIQIHVIMGNKRSGKKIRDAELEISFNMLLRGEKYMNADQVTLHGHGKAVEQPTTF